MRAMLSLATELGDAAFLLPASAVVAFLLLLTRSRRAALVWASAIGLCGGLTILAKLAFHACGADLPGLGIRSPSGHTSLSATFYGCIALTIAVDKPWPTRLGLGLITAAVLAAIAESRVWTGAHTPPEIAAGLLLGACCILWYALAAQPNAVPALAWPLPLVLLVALGVAVHGRHFSLEGRIAHLADRLSLSRLVCPAAPEEAAVGSRDDTSLPAS